LIPIGDENPSRIFPIINWLIILSCIGVFIWQTSGNTQFFRYTINTYGIIPDKIFRSQQIYSLGTSMFLHGGIVHLLGNMLFLWIFGDNIEDKLGHIKYLGFYLISGILASVIWIIAARGSSQPVVGASGAISAVMAAYLIMYPSAKIRTLVTLGLIVWPLKVPAYVMIGLWITLQVAMTFLNPNTGIAYLAHVGGFLVGFIFANLMTPRKESRSQE
jgi:membrane associated rhomboid family serine protease